MPLADRDHGRYPLFTVAGQFLNVEHIGKAVAGHVATVIVFTVLFRDFIALTNWLVRVMPAAFVATDEIRATGVDQHPGISVGRRAGKNILNETGRFGNPEFSGIYL